MSLNQQASLRLSRAGADTLSAPLSLFYYPSAHSILYCLFCTLSSFSIFPFSFLFSFFSFLLSLPFSLPISMHVFPNRMQNKTLILRSVLLSLVFLLRFQALRYCNTAAMILAELAATLAAKVRTRTRIGPAKVGGFFALLVGLFLLSLSWDRTECFPFSAVNVNKLGFATVPGENCVRLWPMLLPFLSGFLGCYEQVSMNLGNVKELGRKRVRLISLFYTTVLLFIPAVISMFVFEAEGDSISCGNLSWPLANTVVFGVLLSENYADEKVVNFKDSEREFVVTFVCTIILELFYFPEVSLLGLLLCGLLNSGQGLR